MTTIIKTASWFTALPADHVKVGISRGVPRRMAPGYRRFRWLQPGPWFRSVTPSEYLELYSNILAALDPQQVADDLCRLAAGGIPVMCCYESPARIQSGEQWCHRHIVAAWLRDRLGLVVEEVGAPADFDPFVKLRAAGIPVPNYSSER